MTGIAVFQDRFNRVRREIERVIHGKSEVVSMALVCLFAQGHLLIEDVPGVAKTTLAKGIAAAIGGEFRRVQFTPDLLPSDVTGGLVFEPQNSKFSFHKGPVFCNVLLGDEINRASPKTQSALLQVMAEGEVTAGVETHRVEPPFVCIATQNPIDHQGTYPLPEAQLDRFMMRLRIGYPSQAYEERMLAQALADEREAVVSTVLTPPEVIKLMGAVRDVKVNDSLRKYIVRLVNATRQLPEVRLGISPRGTIALARAARVYAASRGQSYATPDDVKAVAVPVLNHRLLLSAEAEARGEPGEAQRKLVTDLLDTVPVPGIR